jgi:toxin ParE1/3/4
VAQVRWTVGAASDLERIADYLAGASEAYASAFVERVLASITYLEDQPRLGRVVPEYGLERLKELIVREYRVVCVFENAGDVRIYAIHHGSRDLRTALGDMPGH